MEIVFQGLVGLSCIFLASLGLKTMIAPKSMVEILAVKPQGPACLNTIRGFLGGLFIGSSTLLATGLVKGNATFFLAVGLVMGVVVVGRLVGIAVDGLDKKVLFPLIAEMTMATIFILAYTQL